MRPVTLLQKKKHLQRYEKGAEGTNGTRGSHFLLEANMGSNRKCAKSKSNQTFRLEHHKHQTDSKKSNWGKSASEGYFSQTVFKAQKKKVKGKNRNNM